MTPQRPGLFAIVGVFARYANLTWGGGSATIAVIQNQIVRKRGWISELQFDLAFALSRLTPGTNLLAFCTAAGWLTRRWLGAIAALLASSLPCSVLVVVVTHFYEAWQHNPIVLAGLRGALAAAVAVMFYTAWHLASAHIKAEPLRAAIIVPGAVALTTLAKLSPVTVLLLAAAVGLAWPARDAETGLGPAGVKFLVLYFLFLKATATTFAGLASLPEIRAQLVVQRHLLSDEQLNSAVVITRSTPGPVGVYVVSVGYFAAGLTGAAAGWLAMATPALAIILLMSYMGRRAEHPRVRGLLRSVVLASAALLATAAIPLAREAVRGPLTVALGVIALLLLLSKKVDTLWVILGAAAVSLVASFSGVAQHLR